MRNSLSLSLLILLSLFSFGFHKNQSSTPYQLNYPLHFGGRFSIPEDNPMTEEGIQLGRMLFYETKLSKDNQISCASCHQQELAFTDGKKFSEGVDGGITKRNSMSLANLLWVRNFFWDGRAEGLEAQAVFPLTDPHEMGQSLEVSVQKLKEHETYPELFENAFESSVITKDRIIKALAQFERTLISADSPYDRFLAGNYTPTEQELRGMELFRTGPQVEMGGSNCEHCHGSPKMFKELFHNNGLDQNPTDIGRMEFTSEATDLGRFRVPTLRNIALTGPYMHDGRFETLAEVLDHYSDHIQVSETLSPFIGVLKNPTGGRGIGLSAQQKEDLLAFLNMLTDSTFISNPAFSNPHLP